MKKVELTIDMNKETTRSFKNKCCDLIIEIARRENYNDLGEVPQIVVEIIGVDYIKNESPNNKLLDIGRRTLNSVIETGKNVNIFIVDSDKKELELI